MSRQNRLQSFQEHVAVITVRCVEKICERSAPKVAHAHFSQILIGSAPKREAEHNGQLVCKLLPLCTGIVSHEVNVVRLRASVEREPNAVDDVADPR
jgi:hypothetical protein